jgi:hypothetical protein
MACSHIQGSLSGLLIPPKCCIFENDLLSANCDSRPGEQLPQDMSIGHRMEYHIDPVIFLARYWP